MSSGKPKRRRRVLLLLLTAVGAYAASLGSLRADDLGADNDIVASCDSNGIDVEYLATYNQSSGQYLVEQVTARNVSVECEGLLYEVTLSESAGGRYSGSGTLTLTDVGDRGPGIGLAGDAQISVSQLAEKVDGIALVIHGLNEQA